MKTIGTECLFIRDRVKVSLVNLGEGVSGDYNPEDPEDENLLRFDVSVYEDGQWQEVPNASYCTNIRADLAPERHVHYLGVIMDAVYDNVMGDKSIKRICEELSWIGD